MQHAITKRLLITAALIVAALPAAADEGPQHTPLTLEAESSGGLAPTRLRYDWAAGGLKISGRIEKQRLRYGRIQGHVELELLDADGHIVARHRGAMQQFSPSRRNPDWAAFSTTIDQVQRDVVAVRVSHHVGPHAN